MRERLLTFCLLLLMPGCASQKTAATSNKAVGDTRTTAVELLDDNTYLLSETSDDPSYAYKESNAVKVGGSSDSSGPKNERRFLNALLGPGGEELKYFRAGSCCPFKTPNGLMDDTGLLDRYRVFWSGGTDTLDIYINMYDKGDLKVPVGLKAKTR